MHKVRQLLEKKGCHIVTVDPDDTALQAVTLMNEKSIGAVVVCHDDKVLGVFTERDVMRRIVARQLDASKVLVREVMTTPVACGSCHSTLEELRVLVREKRIRHIPILDENEKPAAMVSIGDLNICASEEQEETIRYLEQYMTKP